jgi:hypothetical protein
MMPARADPKIICSTLGRFLKNYVNAIFIGYVNKSCLRENLLPNFILEFVPSG